MKKEEEYKKAYEQIGVPKEIDLAIEKGIKEGKEYMKTQNINEKSKKSKVWIKGVAAAVVVVVGFGVSVNVSPAFADSLKEVPLLGSLVKVFQKNEPKVSGGEVTDGTDVSLIRIQKNEQGELITIDFSKDGAWAEQATKYTAVYQEYPSTVTFSVPGARGVSAKAEFEKIKKESNFIKDIYPLITLDDSMVRFVVEFNEQTNVQIKEYENPGSIALSLGKGTPSEETIYSVRTGSLDHGENFAMMEEFFQGKEDLRILKDNNGRMFYEIAVYKNEEEAQKIVDQFNKEDRGIRVFTEIRTGNQQPSGFGE